ncbi:DUF397 domain-containing protein [Actinoplanes sp. NBRC 103695]|uniref:DUF397 domain-containing protein n=1 Tax=Actinoplanes sp. NBRC 103695 TaxID=3032202 RepID=UPI0024A1E4B1|nr:DUF397 domain-containing protein [Actinoplanes sp. NBRC 103695]GLZ00570.1 hypothetical protein Acsp02_78220 [Actinoplanes sp. NBRC 103695]
MTALENLVWTRSSFCSSGACAEVAFDGEFVYLRNNREPEKIIKLDLDEWAALKQGIHNGDF